MKVVIWLAVALVGTAVLAFLGYLWLRRRAQQGTLEGREALAAALRPVSEALERGEDPDAGLIEDLAADAWTRGSLRQLLLQSEREQLFPAKFLTRAALAESELVVWLAHPHELAAKPDQIEFVEEVSLDLDGRASSFLVFRFRKFAPHWAAAKGWMAGIAGPYEDSDSIEVPVEGGVFSTLEPMSSLSPEAHVKAALADMQGVGVARSYLE